MTFKPFLYFFFLVLYPTLLLAQEDGGYEGRKVSEKGGTVTFESLRPKKKKDSITFTADAYKIITYTRDTTAIDASISIAKYYQHNAWGKDMFDKVPFGSVGQPYNTLAYDFHKRAYFPQMRAEAKAQLCLTLGEVTCYYLPTPVTQFTYKAGMEQGQALDVLSSANLRPTTDVFIAHRKLRSLGKYRRTLVSNDSFRAGVSYVSPNKKYTLFAHFANHDIDSQENEGMATPRQFEGGDKQFKDRAVIDMSLLDTENQRESKRYFLQHDFAFLRQRDSLSSYKQIRFRHLFMYETEYYAFGERAANAYLDTILVGSNLNDKMRLQRMHSRAEVELELPYLGKTFILGNAYHYNYYFRNAYYIGEVLQRHQIKDTDLSIGSQWHKEVGDFSIAAEGEQTFVGKMTGMQLKGTLSYALDAQNKLSAGAMSHSVMPNFNYLLYQSDYKNYNWDNYTSFGKENNQTLHVDLQTQWGSVHLDPTDLDNYTYFKPQPTGQVAPAQYGGNIQYLQLKLQKEFVFGEFGLDNTLLYQQVVQDESVLNVSAFVARNGFYFKNPLFNKAMILQTGIGLDYFSKYYANGYDPLLAEFQVQDAQKIGNYPILNFFLNTKIRTMRIFFSLEQFHVSLSSLLPSVLDNPYHYYATPRQPYRGFTIRLGVKWSLLSWRNATYPDILK